MAVVPASDSKASTESFCVVDESADGDGSLWKRATLCGGGGSRLHFHIMDIKLNPLQCGRELVRPRLSNAFGRFVRSLAKTWSNRSVLRTAVTAGSRL